jgi:hypothetical protein
MRWLRLLGWGALTVILMVGGCAVLLSQLLPDAPCTTEVFAKVVSPDGHRTAVVYQIDCGATTGFSRQVALVPTPDRPLDPDSLPRGFFAISIGSGVDPGVSTQDSLVRLRWLSNDALDIAYPAGSRLIRSAGRSERVDITYQTYRGAPTDHPP